MKKLRSHWVGVDDGHFTLFSDFDNGGDMWTSDGPRQATQYIAFSEEFQTPPSVHLTISLWDVHEGHNIRMDFRPIDITTKGFTAVFKTWGDTKIARLHMSWQAIGEVSAPEDDWALLDHSNPS